MRNLLKKSILLICIFSFLPLSAFAKSSSEPVIKTSKKPLAAPLPSEDEFETYETESSAEEIYDPYEKINRKMFAFNDVLDRYFLEHVARAYRASIPRSGRNAVRNFLTNLAAPISAVNSLLQGKVDNGLATFSNFLINSTIGVAGLFDVAGEKGIRYKTEDFGQTLGHYGTGPGPYLMLPFLGPSSTRDVLGLGTDKAVSPVGFNAFDIAEDSVLLDSHHRIALTIAGVIDTRESLIDIVDDIRADSFDPYATIRSAYLQKRSTDLKN